MQAVGPAAAAALSLLLAAAASCARIEKVLTPGDDGNAQLGGSVKFTGAVSRAPDDPILYPNRNTAAALVRARLILTGAPTDTVDYELAYEQRMAAQSHAGAAIVGAGVWTGGAGAPWRIAQLDWPIRETGRFTWRHEIDRALVAFHPEWGEAVIGRQAIGLGRGVLFGALDMFSPFSPTEFDREWRRGVDAARLEYKLTDTTSAEAIAVFGESWDESALLGRVRGYIGDWDGELIFGKRAEDLMAGFAMSGTVGQSEVHGEFALFHTPEDQMNGGVFGSDDLVPKAVLGASHTFSVGNGLTVLGEYHYNGFGLDDAEGVTAALLDPDFVARYLRGDMQTLGRHAVAVQGTYPISAVLNGALLLLMSPTDGSGLVSPGVTWDLRQNMTLLIQAYVPWGAGPSGGQFRSFYGGSPASVIAQLGIYF